MHIHHTRVQSYSNLLTDLFILLLLFNEEPISVSSEAFNEKNIATVNDVTDSMSTLHTSLHLISYKSIGPRK